MVESDTDNDSDNSSTIVDGSKKKKKKNKKKKGERGRSKSPSSKGGGRSRSGSRGRRSKSPSKRGKNDNPIKWSKEELLDKVKRIGKFNLDDRTGAGTLDIIGKRILVEEQVVLKELCRRYTEIQTISIKKNFLNDSTFLILSESLIDLRHLRSLTISDNILTVDSIQILIDKYSKLSRKVEHLDIRNNNITGIDGLDMMAKLYKAFPFVLTLNGIKVLSSKRDQANNILDCNNCRLKYTDMIIVTKLLHECPHIDTVILSNNLIDSKGGLFLCEQFKERLYNVTKIDISFNPLTDEDKTNIVIENFMQMLRIVTHITEFKCDGNKLYTQQLKDRIDRSCSVNRVGRLSQKPNFFTHWITDRLEASSKELPTNKYKDIETGYLLYINITNVSYHYHHHYYYYYYHHHHYHYHYHYQSFQLMKSFVEVIE